MKKPTAVFLTALLAVLPILAALPATDNFNRANGPIGSNWTAVTGAWLVDINEARPDTAANFSAVYWNADTFGNDQYAQVVIKNIGTPAGGPAVRIATGGAQSWYVCYVNSPNLTLDKLVGGAYTSLATAALPSVGDTLRTEVSGTTVRCLVNGTQVASVTDTSLASGAAGLSGYNAGNTSVDDFEAGNLSVARRRQVVIQ